MTGKGRSRAWIWAAQAIASVAMLLALVWHARGERVLEALGQASFGWLLVAVLVRAVAQVLHELRIWVALLPWKRARVGTVLAVGLVGGLLNVVLPFRGGDVATVALLVREEEVPSSVALASVGIVAFLEAALFGLFLGGLFLAGWGRWVAMLGLDSARHALAVVTVLTVVGIAIAAFAVLAGRRWQGPGAAGAGVRGRILDTVQRLLAHTHGALGTGRDALWNVGFGVLHLAITVAGVVLCLPAASIHLEDPVLAASAVLALGAIAGLVLPPSLAAGPAASAVFALGFFGVSEPQALAYAALAWLHAAVPAVVLGLPPLWSRLGQVGRILGTEGKVPGTHQA